MEQFTLLFMDYLWNKGVQHTNELTTLKTQTDAQAQNSGRMNFIMTRLFLFIFLFSLALLRWQVTLWVLFKLQSFLPYSLGYFRTTTPEMCNDFPGKCPSWKLTPCWHGKFQTGACHARYLSNRRQRGSIGQAGILGRSSENRILCLESLQTFSL